MALPQKTAVISMFLTGLDPFPHDAMSVSQASGGVISIDAWDPVALGRAEPTEQELLDAEAGSTLINGQTFAQWEAEHGGDPTLTNRRRAKQPLDETTADGVFFREMIELLNKRDNYIITRLEELQTALDAMKASTGVVDNLRAAIPASWLATATRTRADAVQAFKDDIDAGGADT